MNIRFDLHIDWDLIFIQICCVDRQPLWKLWLTWYIYHIYCLLLFVLYLVFYFRFPKCPLSIMNMFWLYDLSFCLSFHSTKGRTTASHLQNVYIFATDFAEITCKQSWWSWWWCRWSWSPSEEKMHRKDTSGTLVKSLINWSYAHTYLSTVYFEYICQLCSFASIPCPSDIVIYLTACV